MKALSAVTSIGAVTPQLRSRSAAAARAGDDQVRLAGLAAHQAAIEARLDLPGVHGIGRAGLVELVRPVRRPQVGPKQGRGPRIHVRAAFDQKDEVALSDELAQRGKEDRGHGCDAQIRAFLHVAPQVGRIDRGNGDADFRAEDRTHVLDIRQKQRLGAGVVGATVADKEHFRDVCIRVSI